MVAVKLLVTIDTEEDEWGAFNLARYSVSNIERLTRLQELFDRFGVRPTYLVTQPVTEAGSAIEVLAPIRERGGCEIGAHCHPWNTPPLVEERTPRNSMLCNLPEDLQYQKLKHLKESIRAAYGVTPTSFRAGRWGFDASVARNLARLEFRVDSSITPYLTWEAFEGPNFDREYPSEQYRMSTDDIGLEDERSRLVEIPTTTGFTGVVAGGGYPIHRAISRAPLTWLRARGIGSRLGLFRTTWLCPEMTEVKEMIDLSDRVLARGGTILNLMFHSTTLTAGLTPFVRTGADEVAFLGRIRAYLEYCRVRGIGSATLSESVSR